MCVCAECERMSCAYRCALCVWCVRSLCVLCVSVLCCCARVVFAILCRLCTV